MPAVKRPSSARTGPASYKRAKISLTPQTKTYRNSNRTEVKQVDLIIPVTAPVTNGDVFVFGTTPQGTDNNQRVGKAITHLYGEMRLQFDNDIGAQYGNWRIIVGIWKQAYNGLVPAASDILQLPGDILSPVNAEDSTNLVILHDSINDFFPTASVTQYVQTIRHKTIKWRYRGTQEYKGPDKVDVQNITHFIYLLTDNLSSAARVHTRCYFTDN